MTFDQITKYALRLSGVTVLLVASLIGVRIYRTTIPKLNAEIDEAHRASVEAGLSAMSMRQMTDQANKAMPKMLTGLQTGITNAGTLLATTNTAVAKLDKNQDAVSKQAVAVLQNLADATKGIAPVLDSTQRTIAGLQPVEASATKMIGDVDSDVNSPDATSMVKHINGIADHVDGITGDVQVRLHPILNPNPCKTKKCKIGRDLEAVKAVGPSAEGLYYLIEVLRMVF